jgi:HK97 family phage portal protein
VDTWDTAFGKSPDDYQPAEYASYLSTSNAVYVCATLRANLLSSLPMRLYRANAGGKETELTQGELYDLLKTPNPHYSLSRLLKMTELSLCLWGEAFWFLERGGAGRSLPKEAWWGRADKVRVVPDKVNYLSAFIYDGGAESITFRPEEVIWFRFPNPADEYEGLSPLAAARLAADVSSAAMKSNKAIFDNGLQIGGILSPPKDGMYTKEQAEALEQDLARRFKGADKAHRVAVLRFQAEWQRPELTPKDAQFIEALKFSLEEVARAYSVPLDFIGGQRTYENVNAANKAIWTHCILPEKIFIEDELNRQLVPYFGGVSRIELDASQVDALQEDRGEVVDQMRQLYDMGVPLNNLLSEFMPQLSPGPTGFEWGDKPAFMLTPTPSMLTASAEEEEAEGETEFETEEPVLERSHTRAVLSLEYGSPEHHRLWSRFVRRTGRYEQEFTRIVVALFERQRDSILDKLKARAADPGLDDLFNMAFWIKEFRKVIHAIIQRIIQDSGNDALDDLGLSLSFDVTDPAVVAFLLAREQRFAKQVNETTWEALQESLSEGIEAGESIPELAERVVVEMGDRIRSTPEVIARTEVIGASNGGTLESWKQCGVVKGKTWLAALDGRTRDTHVEAHGQTVAIDADFEVGDGAGPAPGQIGLPEEDILCRCGMNAVLDVDWED